MALLLEGIRVVDWTHFIVGPLGTMLLGDFGAEVIHIEERVGGDRGRGEQRYLGRRCLMPEGKTVMFESYNRNKKSLAVDISKEKGHEIVRRLVERSHVFVHNFRPGTPAKFKLDYNTLSNYNPKLVYVNSAAFGPKGPDAGLPSTDFLVQARSGFLRGFLSSIPDPEPQFLYPGIGDDIGGMMIFAAVLLGLVAQEKSGRGLELHASQMAGMISAQRWILSQYLLTGLHFFPLDRKKPANPIFNWYKCKDGRWFLTGLFQPDKDWGTFCRVVGMPQLENDPRFETTDNREQNCQQLVSILDDLFATRTSGEWDMIFRKSGLLFTIVNSHDDLIEDRQITDNEYVFNMNHPALGPLKMVGNPIQVGDGFEIQKSPAPEFGQHTEEILLDLGYSWDDMVQLKEQEVIP